MKDATDITFVLDRSGSMHNRWSDVCGGFKTFIDEQKSVPGECVFTLIAFDDVYEKPIDAWPIAKVETIPDGVSPRGNTALIYALCRAIDETGNRLSNMIDSSRPDKIIFAVFTDGLENASPPEYTRAIMAAKIAHQRDVYGWQFLFLGANQDAIAEGVKYGFELHKSMSVGNNTVETCSSIRSLSNNTVKYRATGDIGTLDWAEDDRKAAKS